jgi:hypothetical protein
MVWARKMPRLAPRVCALLHAKRNDLNGEAAAVFLRRWRRTLATIRSDDYHVVDNQHTTDAFDDA